MPIRIPSQITVDWKCIYGALDKKAFCRILKRWFISWITDQNVKRLHIFAILASFLYGNLKGTSLHQLLELFAKWFGRGSTDRQTNRGTRQTGPILYSRPLTPREKLKSLFPTPLLTFSDPSFKTLSLSEHNKRTSFIVSFDKDCNL